jgi:hypothetical protein
MLTILSIFVGIFIAGILLGLLQEIGIFIMFHVKPEIVLAVIMFPLVSGFMFWINYYALSAN